MIILQTDRLLLRNDTMEDVSVRTTPTAIPS